MSRDIKYKFYRNIYSVFVLILFLFRGYFFIFILKLDEKKQEILKIPKFQKGVNIKTEKKSATVSKILTTLSDI